MSLCKRKKEEEAVAAGDAVCHKSQRKGKEQEECSRNGGEATTSTGLHVSYQDFHSSVEPRETTCKRKKDVEEAVSAHASCGIISKTPERSRESYKITRFENGETLMERDKTEQQPTSLPVPPGMKECDAEPVVVTIETERKVTLGPSIGVVDIGVNKFAYFFQVALPGVSKASGEFSCEVDSDGKVILEGSTTTGCETIKRHSRVFKMSIRKLCPPGPFKLSFSLPGPVDPRLFSPSFRSDGIFEAVVIRHD
ncbi:hypothetical protein Bca4012_062190 [Brassica carinata]|uniref:SHSP domain-containing protein n=1 Tax=Brassica carinata TaxID=52824 RepID=A0A8X7SDG4_BRACI|nr:hypothetical protein Bca52824_032081 [Brassica carinata]